MKRYIYIVCAAGLLTACDRTPAYDATGIFEATTVTVSAETAGKILALDVDEGDTVSAGQRTAVIDTALLVLQRRQLGSQKSATESSSPDLTRDSERVIRISPEAQQVVCLHVFRGDKLHAAV